jgi:flagellar protein FliL
MADNKTPVINLKTIIFLGMIIVVIAGVTSFGLMYYFNSSNEKEDSKVLTDNGIGPTYQMGEFVVNLSGTGGYQFIKASIVLETDEKNLFKELDKRDPQLRDMIIAILREQKLTDIEDPGAGVIKNRIKTTLNQVLTTGEIKSVWFTELVIQ